MCVSFCTQMEHLEFLLGIQKQNIRTIPEIVQVSQSQFRFSLCSSGWKLCWMWHTFSITVSIAKRSLLLKKNKKNLYVERLILLKFSYPINFYTFSHIVIKTFSLLLKILCDKPTVNRINGFQYVFEIKIHLHSRCRKEILSIPEWKTRETHWAHIYRMH